MIWIETPTNPTLRLPPIHRLTALIYAHYASTPASRPYITIDATFLSPFYITPLSSPINADLVVHSLTKYINGHSDVLMGSVTLRLPSPTPSYQTASHPTITQLYEKLIFLQNAHGAVPSAFDAYLAQRGAKTLPLRMKAHGTNALRVAQFLREQAKSSENLVEEVRYPGLLGQKGRETAWKIMSVHAKKWVRSEFAPRTSKVEDYEQNDDVPPPYDFPFGGIVSFKIAGGAVEAERFLTRLRLFVLAESLGGVESLAEVPDRMTHGVRILHQLLANECTLTSFFFKIV
jgi:cystathionine gamma-lyase